MSKLVSSTLKLKCLLMGTFASCLVSGATYAADCKSQQKGNEVFADKFADDSGGWAGGEGSAFGKPALTLTLYTPYVNWLFVNNTFNASDGDYCTEAVLPKAPSADNLAYVGIVALYKDPDNLVMLQIDNKADINLYRKVAGTWSTIGTYPTLSPAPAPGSVVTLRMTVKGTLITPYVDGKALKKIRVQLPSGPLKFGVYVQLGKGVPKPGVDFQFNNYRVTSGE